MFALRPANERGHTQTGWLDSWHTFSFGQYHDPRFMGFSDLRVINDDTVAPGEGFGPHPHDNMEIVSIVLNGELEHRDSMGNGTVIKNGEVQKMSAGSGMLPSMSLQLVELACEKLSRWMACRFPFSLQRVMTLPVAGSHDFMFIFPSVEATDTSLNDPPSRRMF